MPAPVAGWGAGAVGTQQQTHPTVDYGLPGGQQAVVLPPTGQRPAGPQQQFQTAYGPQGGYGYGSPAALPQQGGPGYSYAPDFVPPPPQQAQPQQQQQPLPGGPFMPQGQPQPQGYGYQQTPQQQFQAPQQPQQMQQPQGPRASDVILDGPDVPPELRGRRMSDAFRIYTQLANHYVQQQYGRPQPQGQAPQQPQGAQQPQPQGGQPQQLTPAQFWQDPITVMGQMFDQKIQQAVGPMLQPVVQGAREQSIRRAMESASQSIPDFQQLYPDIISALEGSSPENLANPEIWQSAADLARGKRVRQGQVATAPTNGNGYPQPQQGSYGQPHFPAPPLQPMGPGAAVPAYQPPAAYQFFTESPTPPNFGYSPAALSQQELQAAAVMGMTPETYASWKGGVERR